MATDLVALREALLNGAIAKLATGIKRYTIAGRTVEYHSPEELVLALLKLESVQNGGTGSAELYLDMADPA